MAASKTFVSILFFGTQSQIDSTAAKQSALIMSTDEHRLSMDVNGTRIEVTDFVRGYTAAQIIAKSAGSIYYKKIYQASDTLHLYVYQNDSQSVPQAVDITDFKVTSATSADYATNAGSAVYAQSASTANMYHADVADEASGVADEGDFDFGDEDERAAQAAS